MRLLDTFLCRVAGHRWVPYGPPPRYADYLPHVVSCSRCGAYRFADGTPLPDAHRDRIRPYPARPEPDASTGWFRYPGDDGEPPSR